MAGCGYVCPLCEGKGVDESGKVCSWCSQDKADWIAKVHNDCSCSDIGKDNEEEAEQNED